MAKNKITEGMVIPKHIGIIMDGNGRWAKKRLQPRSFGHSKGVERIIGLLQKGYELGVDYVTVYALSTENLKRPKEELDALFKMIHDRFFEGMRKICEQGVRLRVFGDLTLLPEDIQEIVKQVEEETKHYTGKGINIALAYGSRAEIVRAVNRAIEKGESVTEESFSKLLYSAEVPDPDLIIRTGKEKRLSNFLMWQAAYSEFYFSDKMFPDFSDEDLVDAIVDFSTRKRRFGKTDEQVEKQQKD